jgi:hypothetical protein
MTQPNGGYGVPPQLARGKKSPVARDDLLLVIDQKRNVESKRLDALSDLADLFVAMNPGVSRVRFQGCSAKVCNSKRVVDNAFAYLGYELKNIAQA